MSSGTQSLELEATLGQGQLLSELRETPKYFTPWDQLGPAWPESPAAQGRPA